MAEVFNPVKSYLLLFDGSIGLGGSVIAKLRLEVRRLSIAFVVMVVYLLFGLVESVSARSAFWEAAIERVVAEQHALAGQPFDISWPATRPKWPECIEPKVQLGSTSKPVGRLYISLRCDSPRWSGSIQVTVSAKKRYVASSRPLSLGAIITDADVNVVEGDWSSLPDDVLTEPDQAIGRTISRALVAGQPIGLNFLRQTAVIKSGDRVRVQMVGSNFTVGGEGTAAQHGSVGESIRVKMASGQTITATVVRPGVVEIRAD